MDVLITSALEDETSSNNFFRKEIIKWPKRFQVLLDPFVQTSILFGILIYKHFKLINHNYHQKTSNYKNNTGRLVLKIFFFLRWRISCQQRLIWYAIRLLFNFFYHISEVEINIALRRGAVDNCNIKWSNAVNLLPSGV